jgi:hypothetical protein
MAKQKKTNHKVMVKIYTLDSDGDVDELVRQFDVVGKSRDEQDGAFTIGEKLGKTFLVDNIEAWTV